MQLHDWVQVVGLAADILGVLLVAKGSISLGNPSEQVFTIHSGREKMVRAGWSLIGLGFAGQIVATVIDALSRGAAS